MRYLRPSSVSVFFSVFLFFIALQVGFTQNTSAAVWTDTVFSSSQALLKNGNPITDPARTDPVRATGVVDAGFFSLGYGGEVVLKFPTFVEGLLTVYEATGGTYPLETADVFISPDGIVWTLLGEANNTAGGFSRPTLLSLPEDLCVQYVRIVDKTNPALHTSTSDAFDVDAVSAEFATECEVCEIVEQATPLIAGQHEQAGDVTVVNDGDNLYVTFSTDGGWVITETHLATGETEEDLPQNKKGNPKVGHFAYSNTHDPAVTEVIYTIPLDEVQTDQDGNLVIAAHAVVKRLENNEVVQSESAWGQGTRFVTKGNWAMYFEYTLQECEEYEPREENEDFLSGDFRTQTIGGWGTAASGDNPGGYRDAHFSSTFPGGLMIGTVGTGSGWTAQFTGSPAVEAFLPQGGAAGVFTQNYVDPLTTSAGVLAGQATALTLNIEFDLADPSFGASPVNLNNLIVDDAGSACFNMTVQQVIDEANNVLAALSSPLNAAQVNACATGINENFIDGTIVGTFLRFP